ncbi:MAG TPA: hypothetical protein VMH22_05140 [bacterium]|nr:hypothetical protein [bacterium]
MDICSLCGVNEGRVVTIPAERLYLPYKGTRSVCVCDACMRERACPGRCEAGFISVGNGQPSGTHREGCHVCGGSGTFDYTGL